jgi:fructokinase
MRIGIDLGGTKIEALALESSGAERLRLRVPTPRDGYDAVVDAIVGLVRDVGPGASVGLGIPGTISPATGLVKNANTTHLIGHPLDRDLSERLGRLVRVANDANCFALSEASDGAGAPPPGREADRPWVVFGVIIGTGTGAGVVVDGRVLVGPNGIAGEWGHNPLPWPRDDERPGPACYCGKHGCLETVLSGPGLARDHRDRTGGELDTVEIAARADAGDAAARETLARYADRLARGLATVMNVLDPDVIVLGGGVSNVRSLYEDVPRLWGRYVFSDTVRVSLRQARHGDSSGVRGAAWLWPNA